MESVRFGWGLLYFPLDSTKTLRINLRKLLPQDKEHQPEGRKPSQEEHQPLPSPGHFQTEEEDLRRVDQVYCGE